MKRYVETNELNVTHSKCTCWWELPPCLDDRRQESARPRPADEKCTSTSCSVEHPCFAAVSLDKLLHLSYTPVKYHQSSCKKSYKASYKIPTEIIHFSKLSVKLINSSEISTKLIQSSCIDSIRVQTAWNYIHEFSPTLPWLDPAVYWCLWTTVYKPVKWRVSWFSSLWDNCAYSSPVEVCNLSVRKSLKEKKSW